MAYLVIFIYVYFYSFLVRIKEKKYIEFVIGNIPIIVILIMTLGLQKGVGTDYYSYYSIAEGTRGMGWIARRSETLFIRLVDLIIKIGNPQLLFVFVGIIQVIFLIFIAYEVKKLGFKMHDFFFLYFTLSLTFFNQFNGIRQYIAVYIVVYAFLKLLNGKKIAFVSLVMLGSLFHSSSIFFLPFIVLEPVLKKKFSTKSILLVTTLLMILTVVDISKYLEFLLSFTSYKSYIGSNYFGRMRLEGIITKLPKLIIVLLSSIIINKRVLKEKEIQLLNLGYIGVFFLIISFNSNLLWRFYQFVDLFIIFPVLILFNDDKNKNIKFGISIILFVMIIIKIIIIPRGEYLYRSILF